MNSGAAKKKTMRPLPPPSKISPSLNIAGYNGKSLLFSPILDDYTIQPARVAGRATQSPLLYPHTPTAQRMRIIVSDSHKRGWKQSIVHLEFPVNFLEKHFYVIVILRLHRFIFVFSRDFVGSFCFVFSRDGFTGLSVR